MKPLWIPYQRAKPDFMYDQLTEPGEGGGNFVRKSRLAFLRTSLQLAGNGVALVSKIQIVLYEPLRNCIEQQGTVHLRQV